MAVFSISLVRRVVRPALSAFLLIGLVACDEGNDPIVPAGCMVGYEACGNQCVPLGQCAVNPDGCVVGYQACNGQCVPAGTCGAGCSAGYEACNGQCVPAGTCNVGTGGVPGGGGTPVTGGVPPTGGVPNTGGVAPTGGVATGGTPEVPIVQVTCNDSSSQSGTLSSRYQNTVLNAGSKSYYLQTNWWGAYANQAISYRGLSFSISGNTPNDGDHTPAGFPSLYIGRYQGRFTSGSNLPKLVSQIRSIPSVLEANSNQLDYSDFNTAYDIWLTASGSPLSDGATNPGAGGAYLMIWLYRPDRNPIGGTSGAARTVPGVAGLWNVHQSATGGPGGIPIVTYIAQSPLCCLHTDLNLFIKDAVSKQLGITSSQYVSVIFAGFEVWSGANSAQISKFCVDVQ